MNRCIAKAAIGASIGLIFPLQAATLVGLTSDNRLVWIDTDKKTTTAPKAITGSDARIVGIDVRPSNGKLYAVSATGQVFTLAADSGAATPAGQIAEKVELDDRPVVDFNLVPDRLRVIGASRISLRINVDTGQIIIDKPIAIDADEASAARKPAIAAGAYIDAVAGAKAAELFHVDAGLGALVAQNPPNDGILKTRGALGVTIQPIAAMDIVTDGKGGNTAYLLSGKAIYSIDLESAQATSKGRLTE
jgi:hypothetical protein